MSKVRGPLFSGDAAGTLAGGVVYSHNQFGRHVKGFSPPVQPGSLLQQRVKAFVKLAVRLWRGEYTFTYDHDKTPVDYKGIKKIFPSRGLYANQRQMWAEFRGHKLLRGYWLYMRRFLRQSHADGAQYQTPPKNGFCITGEWLTGELVTGGGYIDVE